jgi:hypothetical protein
MNTGATIHYDPRLIEEVVFHAQRDQSISQELHEARNRIYEIADADEREGRFNDLNRSWFLRLGLGKTIEQAVQEQPIITEHVEQCFVVRASHKKQEGAELFVARRSERNSPPQRTLRVLLRPESLFDAEDLTMFLRHELLHSATLPFCLCPSAKSRAAQPMTLISSRYGVWDDDQRRMSGALG